MCIFCDIARDEDKSNLLYEDEKAVAFNDIHPVAPVHILIVPKKHIRSVNQVPDDEKGELLMGHLLNVARRLAELKGITDSGYQLLIRTGIDGGQEIDHLHLHLMGGKKFSS